MALTFDQFYKLLIKTLEGSALQLSVIGAKAGEAELKRRIFNDGLAADGSRIGQYSTKPGNYGEKSFIVRSAFKPPPNRKTVHIPTGYKGLRQLNGRQVGYVDLSYTGSLMQSIRTVVGASGAIVAIEDEKEIAIAEGNEERYGKQIFIAGEREEQAIIAAIEIELEHLLNTI